MDPLVSKVLEGDKIALEKLVKDIQGNIFNLSIRFLWSKEDAEDATQEILIKVITSLVKFQGKSKLNTWVYRIAVNHLLNLKKNKLEQNLNFTSFGKDLGNGLDFPSYESADKNLLTEEVKIGCTLGMLICLDRDLRMCYLLGEVFELNSNEAAEILNIKPENFRKRLSKARSELQDFMRSFCGLTHKANPCRCDKRINCAISKGKVNPLKLNFVPPGTILKSITEMEELYATSAVFKSHPSFLLDKNKSSEILAILNGVEYLLN